MEGEKDILASKVYLSLILIMCGFQYEYSLIESECETDGYSYKGYGIRVQNVKTKQVDSYFDVSVNRAEVERLARLCNKLQLDPIHIEDVIEDMLV